MIKYVKWCFLIHICLTWQIIYGQSLSYLHLDNFHLVNVSMDTSTKFNDYSTYKIKFSNYHDSISIVLRLTRKSVPMLRLNDCKLDTGINYTILFKGCTLNDSLENTAVNSSFYMKYCNFKDYSNSFYLKSTTTSKRIKSHRSTREDDMKSQIIYEYNNQIFLIDSISPCRRDSMDYR